MQPIKYLPNGYAKMACDKLYREGYDMKPHDIYYAHSLDINSPKRKLIMSVLYGIQINEYQIRVRINQKVVKQ